MGTFISRAKQLALGLLVGSAGLAHGQASDSLTGTWEAGPVTSDVAIESWSDACDAAPQARGSSGGNVVEIEQHGEGLTIRGSGSDLRSGNCGANPKLRHAGSSYNDGVWITRCATAGDEPRAEQGTYTLRALGPDRLLYQDVSHLNWKLAGTLCRATVTTKQGLVRRGASASSGPAAAATRERPGVGAAPLHVAAAGCNPGPAARISLRPRESELQLGQKLCFQVKVEDAAGCPLIGSPLVWSLEHGAAIRGSVAGACFQAGDRSAESEGHFEVLADLGALRGRATVHVVAHNLRELTAKRVDNVGALPANETAMRGDAHAGDPPSTRFAARALGQVERSRQQILMGIAALLAVAAAVLALARKPRRTPPTPRSLQDPTRRCPSCGALYPDSIAFCGKDGTALSPVRRS